MSNPPSLTYPDILANFGSHRAKGRSDSRAFLAWFLEHYYHLDEQAAQESVCDGPDDKGIDGIYVDDNLERVDVFQAKLYQNTTKTAGDRSLRDLAGTLDQLADADKVDHILQSTGNVELKKLIEHERVAEKINDGYDVKGVFLTNTLADQSARDFVSRDTRIDMFDAARLSAGYVSIGPSGPVSSDAELDVAGFDVIKYQTPEANVLVAPLLASELVHLEGIQNGELFDWNVRQSLRGRARLDRSP